MDLLGPEGKEWRVKGDPESLMRLVSLLKQVDANGFEPLLSEGLDPLSGELAFTTDTSGIRAARESDTWRNRSDN